MVTKIIGIKEFRQNIATCYKEAKKNNMKYIVFNRNTPIFEVKPIEADDMILEKLAQEIAQAREEERNNEVYTLDEVKQELAS
jgi:hypothetical protein